MHKIKCILFYTWNAFVGLERQMGRASVHWAGIEFGSSVPVRAEVAMISWNMENEGTETDQS